MRATCAAGRHWDGVGCRLRFSLVVGSSFHGYLSRGLGMVLLQGIAGALNPISRNAPARIFDVRGSLAKARCSLVLLVVGWCGQSAGLSR
jgi:hypothetical protein